MKPEITYNFPNHNFSIVGCKTGAQPRFNSKIISLAEIIKQPAGEIAMSFNTA